jgi:hypothetical protein
MKLNIYSPAWFKKNFLFLTLFIFNYSGIWDAEVAEQVKMALRVVAKAMAVAAAAVVTA